MPDGSITCVSICPASALRLPSGKYNQRGSTALAGSEFVGLLGLLYLAKEHKNKRLLLRGYMSQTADANAKSYATNAMLVYVLLSN